MGAIPQAFLGEWNTTLEACGSPRSEGRLILEHHHATFFSSKAEVMQVMEENPRRIFVRLRFPGQADAGVGSGPINGAIKEGAAPFTLERRYLLSSNLQRLQDISQGEQGLSRWRCPSGKR